MVPGKGIEPALTFQGVYASMSSLTKNKNVEPFRTITPTKFARSAQP